MDFYGSKLLSWMEENWMFLWMGIYRLIIEKKLMSFFTVLLWMWQWFNMWVSQNRKNIKMRCWFCIYPVQSCCHICSLLAKHKNVLMNLQSYVWKWRTWIFALISDNGSIIDPHITSELIPISSQWTVPKAPTKYNNKNLPFVLWDL